MGEAASSIEEAGSAADSAGSRFEGMGQHLRNVGIAAAAVGAGMAVSGQAFRNHAIDVDTLTRLYGDASGAMLEFASAMQAGTNFNESQIIGIANSFAGLRREFDLTTEQVQQLIIVSADIAAAFRVDIETAAKAVEAAMRGQTTSLAQFGIYLDQTRLKTGDLGSALNETSLVTERYNSILAQTAPLQGVAADQADGLYGDLVNLAQGFQDSARANMGSLGPLADFGAFASDNAIKTGLLALSLTQLRTSAASAIAIMSRFGAVLGPLGLGIAAAAAGAALVTFVRNAQEASDASRVMTKVVDDLNQALIETQEQGLLAGIAVALPNQIAAINNEFLTLAARQETISNLRHELASLAGQNEDLSGSYERVAAAAELYTRITGEQLDVNRDGTVTVREMQDAMAALQVQYDATAAQARAWADLSDEISRILLAQGEAGDKARERLAIALGQYQNGILTFGQLEDGILMADAALTQNTTSIGLNAAATANLDAVMGDSTATGFGWQIMAQANTEQADEWTANIRDLVEAEEEHRRILGLQASGNPWLFMAMANTEQAEEWAAAIRELTEAEAEHRRILGIQASGNPWLFMAMANTEQAEEWAAASREAAEARAEEQRILEIQRSTNPWLFMAQANTAQAEEWAEASRENAQALAEQDAATALSAATGNTWLAMAESNKVQTREWNEAIRERMAENLAEQLKAEAKAWQEYEDAAREAMEAVQSNAETMDTLERVIIGNTNAINSQFDGLLKWADGLIAVQGEYSKLDDLVKAGRITGTSGVFDDMSQYAAAQQAYNIIAEQTVQVNEDILTIQAKLSPFLGASAQAYGEQVHAVSLLRGEQLLLQTALLDATTQQRGFDLATAAANASTEAQVQSIQGMVLAAASADPVLAAYLDHLGLIEAEFDELTGEVKSITLNTEGFGEAQSEMALLTDALDNLTDAIINITVDVDDGELQALQGAAAAGFPMGFGGDTSGGGGLEVKAKVTVDKSEFDSGVSEATGALSTFGSATATAKVMADNSDATSRINESQSALGRWGSSSATARILADNSQAMGAIASVSSALAGLNGRTATTYIDTVYRTIGAPAIGLGGVAGYATGGVVAEMAEWGPELLHFPTGGVALAPTRGMYTVPQGTYVDTAPTTATKMLGGVNVTVNVRGNVYGIDDLTLEVTRQMVPALERAAAEYRRGYV
jgi:hypothetical protein